MASVAKLAYAILLFWAGANSVTGKPVCANTCADTWKKCAGEGIATMKACCNATDRCVYKSSGYSQCRPKNQPLPKAWKAAKVLTCNQPAAGSQCDVKKITQRWSGLNIGSEKHYLGMLSHEDCNKYGYDKDCCRLRCADLATCSAYLETDLNDCYFYDAGVINSEDTQLFLWFDGSITFMRCLTPKPLCDPATREARQVNAQKGNFYKEIDFGISFILDKSYALDACINVCAMNPQYGGCSHFALDEFSESEVHCTPLYAKKTKDTENYTAQKTSQIWSIEACG